MERFPWIKVINVGGNGNLMATFNHRQSLWGWIKSGYLNLNVRLWPKIIYGLRHFCVQSFASNISLMNMNCLPFSHPATGTLAKNNIFLWSLPSTPTIRFWILSSNLIPKRQAYVGFYSEVIGNVCCWRITSKINSSLFSSFSMRLRGEV